MEAGKSQSLLRPPPIRSACRFPGAYKNKGPVEPLFFSCSYTVPDTLSSGPKRCQNSSSVRPFSVMYFAASSPT